MLPSAPGIVTLQGREHEILPWYHLVSPTLCRGNLDAAAFLRCGRLQPDAITGVFRRELGILYASPARLRDHFRLPVPCLFPPSRLSGWVNAKAYFSLHSFV
jgi:hypothetical protein